MGTLGFVTAKRSKFYFEIMDSIIEVAARERADACEVLLYPEGIFYKAYGYSAFRFVRWIRPYQVKKRAYKKLGAQMCYMGFPQAALDGLLGADFRADRMDDGTVVIRGAFGPVEPEAYDAWVSSIPLSVPKPRVPAGSAPCLPAGSAPCLPAGSAPCLPVGSAPGVPVSPAPSLDAPGADAPLSGDRPETLRAGNYGGGVAEAALAGNGATAAAEPSRETEVLGRLHAFALEAATPLECMLFLSSLKKTLNG